jgi:hypothetical protein
MSDDTNTTGDELDLVISESESNADSQDTQESEGESGDAQVQLETEEPQKEKLSPAQLNAKRQEETWLNRVSTAHINEETGKPYEIEDAPKWLQNKLLARLDGPAPEEVAKKVFEQERQKQEFKELQKQIPALTATQAKQLQDKFAELKPLGNVVALRNALEILGLGQKMKEAEQRGINKARQSLPKSGLSKVKDSEQVVGNVPLSTVTDPKKWDEMIRNQTIQS